jgi:gas vesicle protein
MDNLNSSDSNAVLFALLGGAALGALAMVLSSPKTGREIRAGLKALGNRFRAKPQIEAEEDAEAAYACFI